MRAPEAPPPGDGRYDDRYVDPYNQSDVRRYDDRRNGDRDYDDRRDDGRGYSNRDGEDRGYDNRGNADSDYYDDREAPPEVQAERSKSPGTDGGPRPYIGPVAPPLVAFNGPYAPGSVVIDTGARKLYYVVSPTSAYAYPIGVGRQGFTWTGTEKVSRIADWPDWYPPADMRQRKPGLPERMLGGIRNPLGVKAIYLGNTLNRIHGTNEPKSIGKAESSGCIRMMNENVLHLASLVRVGTPVTVVHSLGGGAVATASTPQRRQTWREREPSSRWDERGDDQRNYEQRGYDQRGYDQRDYEPYPDDTR
jgi:lipoprotein-anchoring transpeptidase ErfK/SrfK